MDLQQIFYRFNPWWDNKYEASGIVREEYVRYLLELLDKKAITFITGIRRGGKTTIIKQLIDRLIKNNINPQRILFLSLDHSALYNLTILEIVEKFREIHGIPFKEKIFLFFDEIQYHHDFERDLKTLHDHENVKIYVSGSNSMILKDKKAFLTGRNKVIVVSPLTFNEYLLFKGINVIISDKHLLKKHFQEYLEFGGMPEYVITKDPEKITSLVSNLIYKDIVGKHKIRNVQKINELFLLLCERVGKRLTYNKLANILGIDIDTVSSYISFFEEVYLIYQVSKDAKSLNEVVRSPKKIYIVDNGIKNVFVGFKDKGALMENLVFLKIKNFNPTYYYENNKEIDFIVNYNKKRIAIEVKYKDKIPAEELKSFEQSKFKEKILVNDFASLEEINKKLILHKRF